MIREALITGMRLSLSLATDLVSLDDQRDGVSAARHRAQKETLERFAASFETRRRCRNARPFFLNFLLVQWPDCNGSKYSMGRCAISPTKCTISDKILV